MDKTAKIYSSLGVGKVVACNPTTSSRQLQPILKKLGLDDAAHAFRYGNACLLDHLHTPMCGSIGWGTPKQLTTMGYTHVIGDNHRKVAEQ